MTTGILQEGNYSFIHSYFVTALSLVRVALDPDPVTGTLGTMQRYTLDGSLSQSITQTYFYTYSCLGEIQTEE